jgi:putative ABC transport system substrate-binding protein
MAYRFSLAAFREGLQAAGYREGENVVIEYRWAEGNINRLPELARELVQQKVNVILAGGTVGAEAAKNATREIPIVAAGTGDLVDSGLVTNYARPDRNLTGIVAAAPALAGKRLEIMTQVMPRARNVAVLWNPTTPTKEWKPTQEAAQSLNLALALHGARALDELESLLVAIPKTRPDFMSVLNDPFMFTYRKKICDAAAQAQLPAIYGYREYVDDGGLISYGPSITNTYRRAAAYIAKILKGAKPSDLPVELPTEFEFVINMKAANALGMKIPGSILVRADKVTE